MAVLRRAAATHIAERPVHLVELRVDRRVHPGRGTRRQRAALAIDVGSPSGAGIDGRAVDIRDHGTASSGAEEVPREAAVARIHG